MSDEVNKAESIATIRSPGRPVGSKNKSTALKAAIDAHDPDAISNIVGKTVDAASRGEKWAIELIMDKTVREPERPHRHVRPAAHPFAGGSCARPRQHLAGHGGRPTEPRRSRQPVGHGSWTVNARIMSDIRSISTPSASSAKPTISKA